MKWGWDKIRFNENVPFNPWLPFMKAIRSEQWSFIWQRKDLPQNEQRNRKCCLQTKTFTLSHLKTLFFGATFSVWLNYNYNFNSHQVITACFGVWKSSWNHKPVIRKKPVFVSSSASGTVTLSHLLSRSFENTRPKQSPMFWWVYISFSGLQCDTFTHRFKKAHTWGQISISFWVRNNYPSDRSVQPSYHIIIPALPYLLWRLN